MLRPPWTHPQAAWALEAPGPAPVHGPCAPPSSHLRSHFQGQDPERARCCGAPLHGGRDWALRGLVVNFEIVQAVQRPPRSWPETSVSVSSLAGLSCRLPFGGGLPLLSLPPRPPCVLYFLLAVARVHHSLNSLSSAHVLTFNEAQIFSALGFLFLCVLCRKFLHPTGSQRFFSRVLLWKF